ncbi:MAG TPA: 3D domain-containing protein, partial [Luteimonas sp.]
FRAQRHAERADRSLRAVGDAAGPAPVLANAGGGNSADVATSAHAGGVTGNPDPSYVFFRSIGDGPQGPIGALGVPLSPERSLAVDPRTTPLGAPVFISSKEPAGNGPMQKLMFAQDTGGAIRGSVRADFFWGFGDSAGRMALATNETMQMWLLLPAQQPISAVAAKGMRLRGDKAELPDCVIADEELCVE